MKAVATTLKVLEAPVIITHRDAMTGSNSTALVMATRPKIKKIYPLSNQCCPLQTPSSTFY